VSEDLERAVNDVFRQVAQAEWERAKAALEAVAAAIEVPVGQLPAVLAEAKAHRERWEAEHPGLRWGDSCSCLCARMFHDPGTCTIDADRLHEVVFSNGNVRSIPMCQPCADATDGHARLRQELWTL
jgi:hypothetical protein